MSLLCRWLPLLVIGTILALPAGLRADAVSLRGGGELRGELVGPADAEEVVIRTLSGAQISVSQSEIESVTKRRRVLEEYETLRRDALDTVEGQWELAEWCKARYLKRERERHLKRVIDLEPDHTLAHQQLGHVLHEGNWTTRDEIMRGRGYVKYKGRYMLPQELELVLQEEKESEAEKGWYKRINMWHSWLEGNRPDRAEDGYRNLLAVNDSNAVPALYRAFSNDPVEAQRLLYVRIVAQIGGVKAVGPLVYQSLRDDSDEVRLQAIKGIPEDQYPEAVPVYLRGLKNDLNLIVNRAGLGLGIIGDESVVPALIDALITKHKYKAWVPDQNISIGITPQGQMVQQVPTAMLPPDIAVMALTGQLPYGVQINQTPAVETRRKRISIEKLEPNLMVHAALRKLTGEDFQYDKKSWKAWWNSTRGGQRLKP